MKGEGNDAGALEAYVVSNKKIILKELYFVFISVSASVEIDPIFSSVICR